MSSRRDGGGELGAAIALVLNRRRFMRAAGGTLAAAALPLTALGSARPPEPAAPSEKLGDWTIDDVWGAYPRYADPIGHGRSVAREPAVEVSAVDAGLVG